MRVERDSMGPIEVRDDRLWGAQTQRSFENFRISTEKMPTELCEALVRVKLACARANREFGKLDERRLALIEGACEKLLSGGYWDHFPLSVWQTGSGTQTNMNANEVIARMGNLEAGENILHPNDHVNMSQSTNDIFPTAIHLAGAVAMERVMKSALKLAASLGELEKKGRGLKKSGRTHLQDATPVTFGQEVSGWRASVEAALEMLEAGKSRLLRLPAGGTAVGTGINAPEGFGEAVARFLEKDTGLPFTSEQNKFYALSQRDGLVFAHGALKALAADLYKIANDVRWLASGPRCGLGEIKIPENEPGSSIMPGKVNPTQCEAVTMAACQVMGNDAAIGFAASQGNFELNVYLPLMGYDFLQSCRLLWGSMDSFEQNCVRGIEPDAGKMAWYYERSLMRVTALSPHIGYDNAARVAHTALEKDLTLKQAVALLGLMDEKKAEELL